MIDTTKNQHDLLRGLKTNPALAMPATKVAVKKLLGNSSRLVVDELIGKVDYRDGIMNNKNHHVRGKHDKRRVLFSEFNISTPRNEEKTLPKIRDTPSSTASTRYSSDDDEILVKVSEKLVSKSKKIFTTLSEEQVDEFSTLDFEISGWNEENIVDDGCTYQYFYDKEQNQKRYTSAYPLKKKKSIPKRSSTAPTTSKPLQRYQNCRTCARPSWTFREMDCEKCKSKKEDESVSEIVKEPKKIESPSIKKPSNNRTIPKVVLVNRKKEINHLETLLALSKRNIEIQKEVPQSTYKVDGNVRRSARGSRDKKGYNLLIEDFTTTCLPIILTEKIK